MYACIYIMSIRVIRAIINGEYYYIEGLLGLIGLLLWLLETYPREELLSNPRVILVQIGEVR